MSGEIRVGHLVLGPVETNTWYVYRERTGDAPTKAQDAGERIPALLIDPADAGERLFEHLFTQGLSIERILLTHAHFDHIGGIEGIQTRARGMGLPPVPVACLEAERPLCEDPVLNCSQSMGMRPVTVEAAEWLHDGQSLAAAGLSLQVIATPGHTVGGCCYYLSEAGLLFSGDTLFAGSVGRSDLPTGNMLTQLDSIRGKLFVLPDETVVLPGHGEKTTIGDEKRGNIFLG